MFTTLKCYVCVFVFYFARRIVQRLNIICIRVEEMMPAAGSTIQCHDWWVRYPTENSILTKGSLLTRYELAEIMGIAPRTIPKEHMCRLCFRQHTRYKCTTAACYYYAFIRKGGC